MDSERHYGYEENFGASHLNLNATNTALVADTGGVSGGMSQAGIPPPVQNRMLRSARDLSTSLRQGQGRSQSQDQVWETVRNGNHTSAVVSQPRGKPAVTIAPTTGPPPFYFHGGMVQANYPPPIQTIAGG